PGVRMAAQPATDRVAFTPRTGLAGRGRTARTDRPGPDRNRAARPGRRLAAGPGLRGAGPGRPGRAACDPARGRRAAGGRHLTARRPTLLVLEDLQWCDTDTLTWLQLLLRLRARTPLLVVATARLEELQADPELAAALDQLRSARVLDMLPLGPLSQVDTGIL